MKRRKNKLIGIGIGLCLASYAWASCTENYLKKCWSGLVGSKPCIHCSSMNTWTAPDSNVLWCSPGFASGGYTCSNIQLLCSIVWSAQNDACATCFEYLEPDDWSVMTDAKIKDPNPPCTK